MLDPLQGKGICAHRHWCLAGTCPTLLHMLSSWRRCLRVMSCLRLAYRCRGQDGVFGVKEIGTVSLTLPIRLCTYIQYSTYHILAHSLLSYHHALFCNLYSTRKLVKPCICPCIFDSLLRLRTSNCISAILDCECRGTVLAPTLIAKSIHPPL